MVFNLLKKGFTLIELLVSTAIILLLIVASSPAYNRVRSRNDLRLAAQNFQNCISYAKSLALGPRTGDTGIDSYDALISQNNSRFQCQVLINIDNDNPRDGVIDQTKSTSGMPIVLNSGLDLHETNYFNTINNLIYRFNPDDSGRADISLSNITNLYLNDSSNACLNLRFIYETGELLLEDLGQVVRGICQ